MDFFVIRKKIFQFVDLKCFTMFGGGVVVVVTRAHSRYFSNEKLVAMCSYFAIQKP